MKYKYELPKEFVAQAVKFEEFANGGAQATVELEDGAVFKEALISNSSYIVAMRGHKDLPFPIEKISKIYQTEEDKSPSNRGGWDFWDD